ncbi:alkene reductase [Aquipuribacter hungaricus]|uniref:Alkene reductase n=1 Tax=Aquipuribacter hungaricus TaxID=545624 RepID=A0ABV7WKL2_9MICO
MTSPLLDPVRLGSLSLPNRFVMAPLTRTRTTEARVPGAMNAEYYRQRAGAGLIVSEAVAITPEAVGYKWTPGLWSQEQVDGWRTVTDAVHAAGGRIVAQLWHVGRISHSSFHADGLPVSSTDTAADAKSFTEDGYVPTSTPRRLRTDEMPRVVEDYRRATVNAVAAGFDGVEVHAANGYLLEQFLADGVNDRTDGYGGSIENRARLTLEVVDAVVAAAGDPGTVGIRLSLGNGSSGTSDADPAAVLAHLGAGLDRRGLAYVHYVEPVTDDGRRTDLSEALRSTWTGPFVLAQGFTPETGEQAVAEGRADAVAFGKAFIGNPDLPERHRTGAPLADADPSTFYGEGPEGYTSYPAAGEDVAEDVAEDPAA